MSNELINVSMSFPTIPGISENIIQKVSQNLPKITEKIKVFERNNSQTTISMMTLTMMTGQSPMRLIRQVLAEIDQRKMALAESQVNHAKLVRDIEELKNKELDSVESAELRMKMVHLDSLEGKIGGSLKDVAILIDAYENIKMKHNIDDWDEETFEREEKKHHVRRGFELLYRNIIQYGRAHESSSEYLQQYGVHIQAALVEVVKYIESVNEKLKNEELIGASDLEIFLDAMAEKYKGFADDASERMFGKKDFTNKNYMLRLENKNDN
jgi:hypothetical protein